MGLARLVLSILLGPPLCLVAAICALAAVAAHQGRHSLQFDILAHFAPIWLAGAVVCALVAGLLLRGLSLWMILALAGVGLVAAGSLMLPEFTRSTGPHAPAGHPGQLKIIQFNVWDRDTDPTRTVDWIVAQRPDIVILEETTPAFRRLMEAKTGWRPACRDCEVMIYSRLPPRPLPVPSLEGPSPGPLAHVAFDDALGSFPVVGVHYAWPTDADDQQKQETRLAAVLDTLPRDRAILAGDFNSTPWSYSRRRWDARFGLIRRDRALFSWPAGTSIWPHVTPPVPILAIDHVYAGPGWATVSVERGPKLGSDHYPVVAILAPVARP
ncbi:MAG: endonuclease [Phenylobacterium sp.]|nr:MAG: endonuclease [Phenylobacterium sp.]